MQDNWKEWQYSKFDQLNVYQNQDTFGPPCALPPTANVLNLVCTYTFKEHKNRRKTRCVCDEAPKRRESVILCNIYDNALKQT